jgi:hypothetical protein
VEIWPWEETGAVVTGGGTVVGLRIGGPVSRETIASLVRGGVGPSLLSRLKCATIVATKMITPVNRMDKAINSYLCPSSHHRNFSLREGLDIFLSIGISTMSSSDCSSVNFDWQQSSSLLLLPMTMSMLLPNFESILSNVVLRVSLRGWFSDCPIRMNPELRLLRSVQLNYRSFETGVCQAWLLVVCFSGVSNLVIVVNRSCMFRWGLGISTLSKKFQSNGRQWVWHNVVLTFFMGSNAFIMMEMQ